MQASIRFADTNFVHRLLDIVKHRNIFVNSVTNIKNVIEYTNRIKKA